MSDISLMILNFFRLTYMSIMNVTIAVITLPLYVATMVLLSPITLTLTRTASWGLSKRDMPPIDVYLCVFEALYPDLIYKLSEGYRIQKSAQRPLSLQFWPHTYERSYFYFGCFSQTTEKWTWQIRAGLFAELDQIGFERKELYRFLGEQVEKSGRVTAEQKEAYARVVARVCGVDPAIYVPNALYFVLMYLTDWARRPLHLWSETDAGRAAIGSRRALVDEQGPMDWLVRPGAVLVPKSRIELSKLHRMSSKFGNVWQRAASLDDMRDDSLAWQVHVTDGSCMPLW